MPTPDNGPGVCPVLAPQNRCLRAAIAAMRRPALMWEMANPKLPFTSMSHEMVVAHGYDPVPRLTRTTQVALQRRSHVLKLPRHSPGRVGPQLQHWRPLPQVPHVPPQASGPQ